MLPFILALILSVPNVSQRGPGNRVVDYGAYPDDGLDDTSAIAAAIAATPDGGTLSFMAGNYDVTADVIVIDKSITLVGEGTFHSPNRAVFGDASWETDAESGAVIQSDSDAGVLFDFDDTAVSPSNFGLVIENLTFKGIAAAGPASTLTCTRFRDSFVRARFRGVTYLNCYRGMDAGFIEDSVLDHVAAYGCHTGLLLGENSNSNTILGSDIGSCDYGIVSYANTSNNFVGGTIQGSTVYGFWGLGMQHSTLSGLYFESSAGGAKAISLDYTGGKGELVYTADPATDRLNFSEAHGRTVGDEVTLRNFAGAYPTGLAAGTYYVKATPTSTALTLSATKNGALIDITGAGSGRNFLSSGENGGHNTVSNCYFSTTGDAIDVWTAGNALDLTNATYALTFKSGTASNVVRALGSSFTYTDNGSGNTFIEVGVNGETRTSSPYATAEGGQFLTLSGWYNLFSVKDTTDWFGLELRDDVGYVRFLDITNNVSMMDYHQNAVAGSRYTLIPALLKLGTGLETDSITNYSGSSVTVKNAVFTGASAAASSLAISGITADDSGSVFIAFDGVGGTITAQATTLALGSTNVTTSGTVDGVDVSTLAAKTYILRGAPEELTGDIIGTTETAFSSAAVTWSSAYPITTDDDVEIEAIFDCTGYSGAASFTPRLYWGGKSSGVSLCVAQTAANHASDAVRLKAVLHYDTTGGSPSWWSFCSWTSVGNATYEEHKKLSGQTTQPTNANITVEGSVQFAATPAAGDKVKLRLLRVMRVRSN